MSSSNVELARAWETMRTKRIVTITTLPHWSYGDSKLQQLADYRLWCLEEPIGQFIPYKVGTAFDSGGVRVNRLDDELYFPDMAGHGDELYRHLSDKKDELLAARTMNADDALAATDGGTEKSEKETRRDEKIDVAQRARENGLTCDEAAEIVDMSKSWVSRNTETPDST
jgi:hypothetical protein